MLQARLQCYLRVRAPSADSNLAVDPNCADERSNARNRTAHRALHTNHVASATHQPNAMARVCLMLQ